MNELRAELTDPTTSAQRLFEIAQSNPELGSLIAAHPNAYPELREWIARYAPPTAPEAAVPSATAAPQYSAPEHTVPEHTAPEQTAPEYTAPQHTTPQQAYSPPTAQTSAPPYTAPQFGAQPNQQPLFPEQSGTPDGRRSKKPLFIGIAIAAVVALLAVGGIAWAVIGSKVGGSATPQAAATKIIDGLTSFDPLTLYGSLAPSEISGFTNATETLMQTRPEGDNGKTLAESAQRLKDSISFTVEGIETETEEIAEGVERVTYLAGTITIDGDEDAIVDELMEFTTAASAYSGSTSREALSYIEDDMRNSIDLPYVIDFAELYDEAGGLTLVTVEEGGAWYVSPLLSVVDGTAAGIDRRGLGRSVVEGIASASPEEAAAALADAVIEGDFDDIAAHLPLPERRLMSIYGKAYEDQISGWNRDLTLDNAEFSAERNGSTARLNIDDLTISGMLFGGWDDDELLLTFYDHCLDAEYYDSYWDETERNRVCLGEMIPKKIYTGLGLDEAALIAVQEGGGWFVSPVATATDIAATVSTRISELAERGELEDFFDDIY